jgi:hypothetical protein
VAQLEGQLSVTSLKKRICEIGACWLVALTLAASPAGAGVGNVQGESIPTCGKLILKLRDFGKIKVKDYNSWVPPNFQTVSGPITPLFVFSFLNANNFLLTYSYPDQQGDTTGNGVFMFGTYKQKGRKLRFELDSALDCNDPSVVCPSIEALANTFAEISENSLFGNRDLVTDIPFVRITNSEKLKFKGRIKGNADPPDDIKVKFKAKMLYDIQFKNLSDFADVFDAKGRMKLRARTDDVTGAGATLACD